MNLEQLESAINEAKSIYEAGEISAEEYKNLLKGFDIEKIVTDNAEELQKKEELNKMVTALVTGLSVEL
jgi:hypothetical protein